MVEKDAGVEPNLRPLEESIKAQINAAVEAAGAVEREHWSKVVERMDLGQFRREWLEAADKMWEARFTDPRPDGEMIWITRCRELLREMVAMQLEVAWLREGRPV